MDNYNKFYTMQLLSEFLSSSSSDSDGEIQLFLLANRRKKPRVVNFVRDVIYNYTDDEFRENFRLTKNTCYYLINQFEASDYYPKSEDHRGGKPTISAEKHIFSFLWFAGNKCVLREVAILFNVSESTLHLICTRVMDFLYEISSRIIKFPRTEEELLDLSTNFARVAGFPQVAGCIDGTYIDIRTPAHKIKSTYVNRHHRTALTLQAICDSKKRFLDVFTGVSSKLHDSRIFRLSFINRELPHLLGGDRYHLLGDSAYPLCPFLLTPYRDYGHLTAAQRNFNRKFSATRVLIENSFGLLKGRFRQLIRTDFHSVSKTSKFIISCCVLHNICINRNDLWDELYEEHIPLEELEQRRDVMLHLGEIKRNNLCNLLLNNN